jgi:hypothetical protein
MRSLASRRPGTARLAFVASSAIAVGCGSGATHGAGGRAPDASTTGNSGGTVGAGGRAPDASTIGNLGGTVGVRGSAMGGSGGASTTMDSGDASRRDSGASALDGGSFAMRQIAAPPTYLGTLNDDATCDTMYRTFGFEPVDRTPARHPLFLYFVGTTFVSGDVSTNYDCQAARAVSAALASRGFVALSVEYDNGAIAWLSDHENQLSCLFTTSKTTSVLAAACALPNVNCDLGIAMWGHSQGALLADLASNYDARVRAAWTTGYGGDSRATLPTSRLRVVNGEGDTGNATVPGLDQTTGFTATECPDDGRKQCLRNDGSGWIIVQKVDCVTSSADHCWFDKRSCLDNAETLEPNWVDRASTKPFALEANADWVAATLARP